MRLRRKPAEAPSRHLPLPAGDRQATKSRWQASVPSPAGNRGHRVVAGASREP